jgi:hypothetical protein
VSVFCTLYAALVMLLGFATRDAPLRYAALAGFGIVVAKVGLHDLAASPLPLRVLVTGVLGFVLLAVAFQYGRRRTLRESGDRWTPAAPAPD